MAIPEGESTPLTGVQVERLARRQPAVPASGVRRPVAASRENTVMASADAAPDVGEAPVGRDRDGVGARQGLRVGTAGRQGGRDAAGDAVELHERSVRLTREARDGAGPGRGDVDVQAVGRDRDGRGALERTRAAAVGLSDRGQAAGAEVELLQQPVARVGGERRHGGGRRRGDVERLAVGAQHHCPGVVEAVRRGAPERDLHGRAPACAGGLRQRAGGRRSHRGGAGKEDAQDQSEETGTEPHVSQGATGSAGPRRPAGRRRC